MLENGDVTRMGYSCRLDKSDAWRGNNEKNICNKGGGVMCCRNNNENPQKGGCDTEAFTDNDQCTYLREKKKKNWAARNLTEKNNKKFNKKKGL